MTVICCLFDPSAEAFLLGCNSRSQVGDTVMPADVSKWQVFGAWALALSGNGVPAEAIERRREKFPADTEDPYEVSAHLRKCFDKVGLGKDRGDGRDYGASGLLVRRGGDAYDLDHNVTIEQVDRTLLWARGSGMDYALGAAFALRKSGALPRDVVHGALSAAMALDTSCPGTAMIQEF